jgi:hypothetical protein
MATATKKPEVGTAKERVRKHRQALRASGLRPITRWVPDTRKPEFIEQYRAQIARLTAHSESDGSEFWEWMDQVRCTDGWV